MELLAPSKSEYLLEAGLEFFHEQSIEWLEEIAFWRDETAFFYSLIVKRTLKSVPVEGKNLIGKIEKDLIRITGGELDKLQKEVKDHEIFLQYLLEKKHVNEEGYREKHRELTNQFKGFEKRYKALKKEVFDLVKVIDQ